MPYSSTITRDLIELLDLLDEIPYKYVKKFQEQYEKEDSFEIEIIDLSHNYSSQWCKTEFIFELENIELDTITGIKPQLHTKTIIFKVIKEYHCNSAFGWNMRNLHVDSESESESESEKDSESEEDIQ